MEDDGCTARAATPRYAAAFSLLGLLVGFSAAVFLYGGLAAESSSGLFSTISTAAETSLPGGGGASPIPPAFDALLWRLPAALSASLRAECAGKLPFTRRLYMVVETRLGSAYTKLCAGVWKVFAAQGMHILLLGDRASVHTLTSQWYFTFKLQAMHNWLAAHAHEARDPDHTLVIHADSEDNIVYGSQSELMACFSRVFCERGLDPARDVLFLGERGLWPLSTWYNASDYPTSGDFRYLNSGLYGGSITAVRAVLEEAMRVERLIMSWDDQEVLNYMLVREPEWRARMHLDQSQACLASSYESQNRYRLVDDRWVWMNDNRPSIVHYNGGSKAAEFPVCLAAMNATKRAWGSPELKGGAVTLMGNSWSTSTTHTMESICREGAKPWPDK